MNKSNKKVKNVKKNKTYKNKNKITYLLDIDQTLIYSVYDNTKTSNPYKIYYRPHLNKLLKFFENNQNKYNLGFWSTAGVDYVNMILNKILKNFKKLKVCIILARHERSRVDDRPILGKQGGYPVIKNLLTNEEYPFYYHKQMFVKNVKHFINLKEIKNDNILNNNTILVDDYSPNININDEKYIYAVPPWTDFMKNDNELLKLLNNIKKKGRSCRKIV